MKNRIYHLIIGGNLGNRVATLAASRKLIGAEAGEILKASTVYETQPWGVEDQPWFLNQALEIRSSLLPSEMLRVIKDIETKVGRQPSEKWHARTIDIDILVCGEEIVHLPDLDIPHPLFHQRNFALVPLMEIAPDLIHPVLKKPIDELYGESRDHGEVYIFNLDEQENAV